jgi:hypothetical protein
MCCLSYRKINKSLNLSIVISDLKKRDFCHFLDSRPLYKIRSKDVYPYCSLFLPASDSRRPFPFPVLIVPETWLLWSGKSIEPVVRLRFYDKALLKSEKTVPSQPNWASACSSACRLVSASGMIDLLRLLSALTRLNGLAGSILACLHSSSSPRSLASVF